MNYDPDRDTSWPGVLRRAFHDWKWLLLTPVVAFFAIVSVFYAMVLTHLHVMTVPALAEVSYDYTTIPDRNYLFAFVLYSLLTTIGIRTISKWKTTGEREP